MNTGVNAVLGDVVTEIALLSTAMLYDAFYR